MLSIPMQQTLIRNDTPSADMTSSPCDWLNTYLNHQINIAFLFITGDWCVRPDDQIITDLSRQVDMLANG